MPQRLHVDLVCKFAQFEFKHGSPERGRTTFDGIVSTYPRRVDVWSIYIDMEIRQGDVRPRNLRTSNAALALA